MGNKAVKQQECNRHMEELEEIRRQRDRDKQEALIRQKVAQYHYEEHMAEIRRLASLDEKRFQKEMEELKVKREKNNQMHERETKRINNDFLNRQKELSNSELKINNEHTETIRKLDDDREFNIMKENNSNNNEKNRMELNFQIQKNKLKNDELDIELNRRNEKMEIEYNYLNREKELNDKYLMNMSNIDRMRNRDNLEHERKLDEILRTDEREKERISSNHRQVMDKQRNDFLNEQKRLNKEYNFKHRELNIKEANEKDRHNREILKIQAHERIEQNKLQLSMKKMEKDFEFKIIDSDNKFKQYEINAEIERQRKQAADTLLLEQNKEQHNERMKQMDINHKERMNQMNADLQLKMKQMDEIRKSNEENHRERLANSYMYYHNNLLMMNQYYSNIMNSQREQIEKPQNSENSRSNNNFQMPFMGLNFPNFGMPMNNMMGMPMNNMMGMPMNNMMGMPIYNMMGMPMNNMMGMPMNNMIPNNNKMNRSEEDDQNNSNRKKNHRNYDSFERDNNRNYMDNGDDSN